MRHTPHLRTSAALEELLELRGERRGREHGDDHDAVPSALDEDDVFDTSKVERLGDRRPRRPRRDALVGRYANVRRVLR